MRSSCIADDNYSEKILKLRLLQVSFIVNFHEHKVFQCNKKVRKRQKYFTHAL